MTLKVKILRSRKLKRVLCLECGKEFADLLFSLLVMPVGSILKHLGEGGLLANNLNGLFNLYASTKDLEESTLSVDRSALIDPAIVGLNATEFLRVTASSPGSCINSLCSNGVCGLGQLCNSCETVTWRCCDNIRQYSQPSQTPLPYPPYTSHHQQQFPILQKCTGYFNSQSYEGAANCPSCNQLLTEHIVVLESKKVHASSKTETKSTSSMDGVSRGRGFVKENITFMVKEDLSIIKSSALSAIELLQSVKSDFTDLDTKEVKVGKEEGLRLVKAAMTSKTPLTDVFERFFK